MRRLGLIVCLIGWMGVAGSVSVWAQQPDLASVSFAAEPRPITGHPAPPFSLPGMDGQTYSLTGARDKPLVLNFWASWCGPCRLEAPMLRELYEKYRAQIDLYAINATADDKLEAARQFVAEYELPFPVPLDVKGEVSAKYRLYAIPTTFFIDKSGVIQKVLIGVANPADFERYMKELLEKSG